MPVSIRTRLLLLTLAWVLPAVAAGLLMAYYSALAERDANQRMLRETARALALVVDREIQQRVTIARLLAESRTLDALPALGGEDRARFAAQAANATRNLFGWVELHDAHGLVLSTERPVRGAGGGAGGGAPASADGTPAAATPMAPATSTPAPDGARPRSASAPTQPRSTGTERSRSGASGASGATPNGPPAAASVPASPATLHSAPRVTPLQVQPDGVLRASIVAPVYRQGQLVANVVVTLLPLELQRVVNDLGVPTNWVASVIDSGHVIAARYPGGEDHAGGAVPAQLRERLSVEDESLFEIDARSGARSSTADGLGQVGYYSTSKQGWAFLVSMPQQQFAGFVVGYLLRMGIGGLVMLALAIAGALWVSRGIVACIVSLERAAAQLHLGQAVPPVRMGIRECDAVMTALVNASSSIRQSRAELEEQVDEAVRRTRAAEQRASQGRRIEALGRLTGGVAHDFNNLLGVIANSALLVQRHVAEQPALRTAAGALQRAVESGQRLTQHLLRFAGRRPVQVQAFDLQHDLPEVVEMLRSAVGQRIEVVARVDPAARSVPTDPAELELALINLAINARDAMPEGGRLEIVGRNATPEEAEGLPARDYVAIDVRDTGVGIDPQVGERVFEPFFTTKAVGRGTGLGLSQVHGYCTQAGGTARLRSGPGEGTTVTLLLPAGAAPAASHAPKPAGAPLPLLAGTRVLLVEDNEALAEVTQAVLVSHGCRVSRAGDAQQALQRIGPDEAAFDLVLTDVVMPGALDGLALASRLRARFPSLPVVLMTGYSEALRDAAGFPLLHKPYTEEELLSLLATAMRPGPAQAHEVP